MTLFKVAKESCIAMLEGVVICTLVSMNFLQHRRHVLNFGKSKIFCLALRV
jgi:hypothetical protein